MKPNEALLPFSGDRAGIKLGLCRPKPNTSQHDYLIACVPFGRLASKAHQLEVCTIMSDRDFFALLRSIYNAGRWKFLWMPLRRVSAIHFVGVRTSQIPRPIVSGTETPHRLRNLTG